MKDLIKGMDDVSRRDLASFLAKTCLGVGIISTLDAQRATAAAKAAKSEASDAGDSLPRGKAENVIYLYMSGGMTHLDTFDLKPGADTQGPTQSLKTAVPGVHINTLMGDTLAKQMKHVAVINSMYTTTGDHSGGRYYMHTAFRSTPSIRHPGLGAWILKLQGKKNPILPGNILIGGSPVDASSGFLENKYGPVPLANARSGLPNSRMRVSKKEFDTRLTLADAFDRPFRSRFKQKEVRAYTDLYRDAITLMTSKDLEVFDIRKESKETQDSYGNNGFGQGCLLARRLVEQNVRCIEVNMGGWDTHANNFTSMETRLPQLGQALGALLEDLSQRGMLDKTLVVLATEFGRTPRINSRSGRDHYPKAFSGLLAGGGIKGGGAYGKTNNRGTDVAENPVSVPDFNATIGHALGLDLTKRVHAPSGRPFFFANKGKPIPALL